MRLPPAASTMLRICLLSITLLLVATEAGAQLRAVVHSADVPLPPVIDAAARSRAGVRAHPLIRTLGTLAGSAGGFALAQDREEADPDDLLVPIAAGAAGAALAGIVLSDAHPLRVIGGSLLASLPAGALAVQLARTLDDDEQGNIPLISFSVPHGLLTSGFAVRRR